MRYTYLVLTALAVGLTGCDKDDSSAALEKDDQIARSQPLSESQEEVPQITTPGGETMQSEAHEALRPLDTDPIDTDTTTAAQDYAAAKAEVELSAQSSELAQETEQTAMSIEDKANQIAQQAEEIAQQAETVADNAQMQADANARLQADTSATTEIDANTRISTESATAASGSQLALETPTRGDQAQTELKAAANTDKLATTAKQQAQSSTQQATSSPTSKTETATSIPASAKMQFSDDMLAKGEKVYKGSCAACHASGAAGAPKLDDSTWSTRKAQGMDTLYKHAINGYQGSKGYMPAKGGFANLSDEEVKAAVAYMVKNAN